VTITRKNNSINNDINVSELLDTPQVNNAECSKILTCYYNGVVYKVPDSLKKSFFEARFDSLWEKVKSSSISKLLSSHTAYFHKMTEEISRFNEFCDQLGQDSSSYEKYIKFLNVNDLEFFNEINSLKNVKVNTTDGEKSFVSYSYEFVHDILKKTNLQECDALMKKVLFGLNKCLKNKAECSGFQVSNAENLLKTIKSHYEKNHVK